MRKLMMTAIAAGLVLPGVAVPAAAQSREKARYEYNGKYYNNLAECQRAKKRARDRGTVVGAAAAGVGAAVLGANLGESALIAGGGALVGRTLGKNSKKC